MVDFVKRWADKTEIAIRQLVDWLGITRSKYYSWRERYGRLNEHNGSMPRDHWLAPWETEAIIQYHHEHPQEGYRRLAFMMIDRDIVAVSPATVWRVLTRADLIGRRSIRRSKKGTGFRQPSRPHQHWHIDISYLKVRGTFYYLCSVLDGYSRAIVHWDVRERMTTKEIEITLQRARERHPGAKPRIISDNGPQFIAKEFKEYIRVCEMTHVRTTPFYPESNGKIERYHRSIKSECIRPQTPLSMEDAFRVVKRYVEYYNTERLHAAIGYVTPQDRMEGRDQVILAERDRKLEAAREKRRKARASLTLQSEDGSMPVRGIAYAGS